MHCGITHKRVDLDPMYSIWNQLQPTSKTLLWFIMDNCSQINWNSLICNNFMTSQWSLDYKLRLSEVKSSRTHFKVLGLGLEDQVLGFGLKASSPRKLPCPGIEDSIIFWTLKIVLENARNLAENLERPLMYSSFGDRLKKLFEDIFYFLRSLAPASLVLALSIPVLCLERVCTRKGCPWPRIFLDPWPWPRRLCPRLHLCRLISWVYSLLILA